METVKRYAFAGFWVGAGIVTAAAAVAVVRIAANAFRGRNP